MICFKNKFMSFVLLTSVFLFLDGCSAPRTHPKMLSFTPASVVVDYTDNDLHEATNLAQQYCSSVGRNAQYLRTERSPSSLFQDQQVTAFFNCVESIKDSLNNHNNNNPYNNNPIINNFK